jgi:hypothetical protein
MLAADTINLAETPPHRLRRPGLYNDHQVIALCGEPVIAGKLTRYIPLCTRPQGWKVDAYSGEHSGSRGAVLNSFDATCEGRRRWSGRHRS